MLELSYIYKSEVASVRDFVRSMVKENKLNKCEMFDALVNHSGVKIVGKDKNKCDDLLYIGMEYLDYNVYKYKYIMNIETLEEAHLFMQLACIMGFRPTLYYKGCHESCSFKDNSYNMRYILRVWNLPATMMGVDGMKFLVKLWSMSQKEREEFFDSDEIAKEKVYKDINEY